MQEIRRLEREIEVLKRRNMMFQAGSDVANYASSAKIAEELNDGINRCFFNSVSKSVAFKHGVKPLSDCIQIGTKDNLIKNVDELMFRNGSRLKGLADKMDDVPTEELSYYVPTMNVVWKNVGDGFKDVYDKLEKKSDKGHDHDERYSLLDHLHDERYSLLEHDHDERYSLLEHKHEFGDVYKSIETVNEDGTTTTTEKSLQEIIDEYEASYNKTFALVEHQHEIKDVYKSNEDGTKQTLDEIINELKKMIDEKITLSASDECITKNKTEEFTPTYDDFLKAITGPQGPKGPKEKGVQKVKMEKVRSGMIHYLMCLELRVILEK